MREECKSPYPRLPPELLGPHTSAPEHTAHHHVTHTSSMHILHSIGQRHLHTVEQPRIITLRCEGVVKSARLKTGKGMNRPRPQNTVEPPPLNNGHTR